MPECSQVVHLYAERESRSPGRRPTFKLRGRKGRSDRIVIICRWGSFA